MENSLRGFLHQTAEDYGMPIMKVLAIHKKTGTGARLYKALEEELKALEA